jgi:hypothetical protein
LVRLFDIRTFKELEPLKGHPKEVTCELTKLEHANLDAVKSESKADFRSHSHLQPLHGIPYIAISSPRVGWTDPSLTGASIKRTPQHRSSPSKRHTTRPSGLSIIILWDMSLLLQVKTTRRGFGAVRDRRVDRKRIDGISGTRRARRQGSRSGLSGSRRTNRVSFARHGSHQRQG